MFKKNSAIYGHLALYLVVTDMSSMNVFNNGLYHPFLNYEYAMYTVQYSAVHNRPLMLELKIMAKQNPVPPLC